MYLSRLILNPRSRQVRSEMSNPYEMHRTVMQAFAGRLTEGPDGPAERVLFRLEVHPRSGVPTLLVQSPLAPDWAFLLAPEKDYLLGGDALPLDVENPAVKPVELQLHAGQVLAFRLRANPTVKKDREGKKQGRRVGLVREEDQYHWLERKLQTAGSRLLSANAAQPTDLRGRLYRDGQKQELTLLSVQFDGLLRVEDPELLAQSVLEGIGSGKGLGFGLVSLAPAAG